MLAVPCGSWLSLCVELTKDQHSRAAKQGTGQLRNKKRKKKVFAFGAELNELNVIARLQSNTKTQLKLGQSCLPSVYTRGTINTDMTNGAGQVMESRRVNGSKETQSTGRCEHKFTPPMLKPGSSTPDRHLR